jgi:hypothetical protein
MVGFKASSFLTGFTWITNKKGGAKIHPAFFVCYLQSVIRYLPYAICYLQSKI